MKYLQEEMEKTQKLQTREQQALAKWQASADEEPAGKPGQAPGHRRASSTCRPLIWGSLSHVDKSTGPRKGTELPLESGLCMCTRPRLAILEMQGLRGTYVEAVIWNPCYHHTVMGALCGPSLPVVLVFCGSQDPGRHASIPEVAPTS